MKTTISLTVGIALVLFGAQVVHARGFGGAHSGGGSSTSGYHGGSARSSPSSGYHSTETYHGSDGATAAHGAEGTAVKGPDGNVYTHQSSPGQHPTDEASGSAYHTSNGATAVHGADGTVAKGPDGNVYGHESSAGSAHYGAGGAAGYNAAHVALPTDAGYGMSAARAGTGTYAGYHQAAAVSGSAYAARGAAVRNSYSGSGMYGQGWRAANPGAWAPAGWTAGRAWGTATWPTVGTSLGWGNVQPIPYNYGTSITYEDDQVYSGGQPLATAGDYYQQASTLAQNAPAPDPKDPDWTPLGVFALVQNDQSEPHYVIQLAVNKAGTLGGNYSDLVSGRTLPIQGGVDKKTQRVAWTVGNNKSTVGEAGLYNLTQDEAPALIHIGKNKTQQWLLVRLKQPEQASGEK